MHPKMQARVTEVQSARRHEIYQSLDFLVLAMANLARVSKLHCAERLARQRVLLADVASADSLTVDELLILASKLTKECATVADMAMSAHEDSPADRISKSH